LAERLPITFVGLRVEAGNILLYKWEEDGTMLVKEFGIIREVGLNDVNVGFVILFLDVWLLDGPFDRDVISLVGVVVEEEDGINLGDMYELIVGVILRSNIGLREEIRLGVNEWDVGTPDMDVRSLVEVMEGGKDGTILGDIYGLIVGIILGSGVSLSKEMRLGVIEWNFDWSFEGIEVVRCVVGIDVGDNEVI